MSGATIVRIHPSWRCVCGHVLKAWNVAVEDGTGSAQVPFRILCSSCHTELVWLSATKTPRATERDDQAR
jgi:hypothetical protein